MQSASGGNPLWRRCLPCSEAASLLEVLAGGLTAGGWMSKTSRDFQAAISAPSACLLPPVD
ncbi:hypothetical protein LYNGBM3L_34990 [Moorena producens 3L]|uniref:Uncharacterized protein n=1 Tax=Moorena producens 3L TaxID=489825 RepID=F4XPJ5_9CYAN|nr:hypothetical protein LYNGBM3L_34990 [Moorena producens 3L]OLT63988.1 hypothetical protein BI334_02160 [Moorena producens 3L]